MYDNHSLLSYLPINIGNKICYQNHECVLHFFVTITFRGEGGGHSFGATLYSILYLSKKAWDKLIPDICFVSSRIINFKHVMILTTLLILVVIESCRSSTCTYKNAMYHAFRCSTTILKSMNQCLQLISIFYCIFFKSYDFLHFYLVEIMKLYHVCKYKQ